MPAKYIVVFILLLLSSCAQQEIRNVDLHAKYSQLSTAVKNKSVVEQRTQYFSTKYLKEVNPSDVQSLDLLTLTNYIDKEASHYQKIKDAQGCLTINGFEQAGDPVSLFIEYKNENNNWLVNYIYVNLVENKKDFMEKAMCPDEVEKSTTQ